MAASRWLEETSLVAYSDIVYHADWVSRLKMSPDSIAIAHDTLWRELWEQRFEHPEIDAESFAASNGVVQNLGQKGTPLDAIQGQYVGLMKVTRSGWRQITSFLSELSQDRLDVTALLRQLIHSGVTVGAVAIAGRWCEVDTVQDLLLYETRSRSSERWSHDWRQ